MGKNTGYNTLYILYTYWNFPQKAREWNVQETENSAISAHPYTNAITNWSRVWEMYSIHSMARTLRGMQPCQYKEEQSIFKDLIYSIPIQQSLPIPIQQTAALKALTLFIPYPMCNYVCHVLNIGRFICLPFLCSWIHQPDNKWINLIKTVKHKWK